VQQTKLYMHKSLAAELLGGRGRGEKTWHVPLWSFMQDVSTTTKS